MQGLNQEQSTVMGKKVNSLLSPFPTLGLSKTFPLPQRDAKGNKRTGSPEAQRPAHPAAQPQKPRQGTPGPASVPSTTSVFQTSRAALVSLNRNPLGFTSQHPQSLHGSHFPSKRMPLSQPKSPSRALPVKTALQETRPRLPPGPGRQL